MKKKEVVKMISQRVQSAGARQAAREEQWKALLFGILNIHNHFFADEELVEIISYLIRVKSGWEIKFKKKFGYYPDFSRFFCETAEKSERIRAILAGAGVCAA